MNNLQKKKSTRFVVQAQLFIGLTLIMFLTILPSGRAEEHGLIECGTTSVQAETQVNVFSSLNEGRFSPSSGTKQYVMGIRYTPSAASKVGGVTQLATQVNTAIAGANDLFTQSGIQVEIVLGYLEPFSSDSDYTCPTCEALNKTHRPDADAVILETGLAYASIPNSVQKALAGATLSFGVQNFKKTTLAHEVGHTLGLDHGSRDPIDTTVPGIAPEISPPLYGVGAVGQDLNGNPIHTIMSYGNVANTSVQSGLFSSPSLIYNGVPTGTHSANAVRAANYWSDYVTQAGEYRYPLPISIEAKKDGRYTFISGKCFDETGGAPSIGQNITIFHLENGNETLLVETACGTSGSFQTSIHSLVSGSVRAFHTGIQQYSEGVNPTWSPLSLYPEAQGDLIILSGVCYDTSGTIPLSGARITIYEITDSGDKELAIVSCDLEGKFEYQIGNTKHGKFWASIPGVAFTDVLDLSDSDEKEDPTTCNRKKLKRLQKKVRTTHYKKKKKQLRRKLKSIKNICAGR